MTTLEASSVLCIHAPVELIAANVPAFRDQARAAVQQDTHRLDVDLRRTQFIDSSGLGALISLHKLMTARSGSVRLLNPKQQVLQVLELTRMHRMFEIARI